MKKIVIFLLLVALTLVTTSVPALAEESDPIATHAVEENDGSTVVYFNDGSTLTISLVQTQEQSVSTLDTAKTISASKRVTYKDAGGNLEWEYILHASFSYTSGVSATCTNAYYTQNIIKGSWSFSDGAATKSGNQATGNGKYVFKVFFVTVRTYNISIHITCDNYGNLT